MQPELDDDDHGVETEQPWFMTMTGRVLLSTSFLVLNAPEAPTELRPCHASIDGNAKKQGRKWKLRIPVSK